MNSKPNQDVDHSLISDVRALLVSAPKGVSMNRFDKDYKSIFGKPFPYRSYGFSSKIQLLMVLEKKGVLKMEKSYSPRDGGWVMHGIPDVNNYLPSWFRKAHDKHCGSTTSNGHDTALPAPMGNRTSEGDCDEGIQPDAGGTYSLHVQWTSCGGSKMLDYSNSLIRSTIYDLMSTVGRPVEIVCVPNKNYAFVRFFQKEEAENALKVNKKTVNQLTFEIKLATPLKYPRRIQPDSIAIPKRGPFPPLPMSSPLCGAVPKGYSKPSHPHDNEDQLALSVDDSSSELSESDWEDLTCTKPCYSSCSTTKHTNTTTSASSGNTVHWSTLISQGSGDVPWTARLEQMCGEAMTVKLIASDHCIEGCSHWLQVMDSHEMHCMQRLQRCAHTYISSMPSTGLCSDNEGVFCYVNGEEVLRCLILDKGGVVNPRVFNIDTGEIITVGIASLKIPPKWFAEFPMLAVPCFLQGCFPPIGCYNGKAKISITDSHSVIPLPLTVQLVTDEDEDGNGSGPPPLINNSNSPSPTYETACLLTPDLSTSSSTDDLQWRFNDVLSDNGLVAVHVSEVVSPALFWVQVTNDPNEDMQWMSDMINELGTMDTRRHIHVSIGNIYAHKNGPWYCRVKVESFVDYNKQQVAVICIDNGVQLNSVCINSLQVLPPALINKPPLAVPCCITKIVSSREDTIWYVLDNQLLWKTIRKQTVYVKYPPTFTSAHWSSMRGDHYYYIVTLHDVFLDPNGDTSVADVMIEEGTFVGIKTV